MFSIGQSLAPESLLQNEMPRLETGRKVSSKVEEGLPVSKFKHFPRNRPELESPEST